MTTTPIYLNTAQDLENWPTTPGESVNEAIDTILSTFWNPIGGGNNHHYEFLGGWTTTPQKVNGCVLFCTTGAEPDQIKIRTAAHGTLIYTNASPVWVDVSGTGGAYKYIDCPFTTIDLTTIHLELKRNAGNPFNLNEVVPYYSTAAPYSGFPVLLKRSFTGRSSYKAPGRRKPKYSSYPDSIHPSSPLAPNEVV